MEQDGNVLPMNSNRIAFEQFQRDMSEIAEKAGFKSGQDVVDAVNQVRQQMWESRHDSNA